jgi:crossover junction endodeoxyribonuclease RuvC
MRVIGIDPGLGACGWGVIDADGSRLRHVANGTIRTEVGALAPRLLTLHGALTRVLAKHAPDAAAVEQTFVNRDGAGTLKLGQARGVAVLAIAAAGLEVGEYMPNLVKKTVVGTGHAAKRQIGHMVRMQLPGCDPDSADAADALAVALCHAFHLQTAGRLAAAMGTVR